MKQKIHRIIFESGTFYGRLFDAVLLILIVMSIIVVMLESVHRINIRYANILSSAEWLITILFTFEYIARIYSAPKPLKYIFSFLGLIDLIAIIPTYIASSMPEAQSFIALRAIRLLRIFRLLKLYHLLRAGNLLLLAISRSARKISIFMIFILILVIMLGSVMYAIEGGNNGFDNIPVSIYWAVITLTTVGYGDIVPITSSGKFIATFIMLLGYSIIAIPTGIVSVEMSHTFKDKQDAAKKCSYCREPQHTPEANFCRICGNILEK